MAKARNTYVISGLRRNRARLAGEIETAERAIDRQRQDLATIDATLRLYQPDADPNHIVTVRPVARCAWFKRGRLRRYALESLRDAGQPLPTRLITDYVMRANGMGGVEPSVRTQCRELVRIALMRMVRRGTVRRIVSYPEAWWELVG